MLPVIHQTGSSTQALLVRPPPEHIVLHCQLAQTCQLLQPIQVVQAVVAQLQLGQHRQGAQAWGVGKNTAG